MFTLRDLKRIYPTLSTRSLQIWVNRGVILPAEPAQGQGSPVGFDYRNLIEVGIIMQLVRFGFDRHESLNKIIREAREKPRRWIDDLNYDALFIVQDTAFMGKDFDRETYIERSWSVQPRSAINFESPGYPAMLIVDVKAIKDYVNKRI